MYIDRAVVQGRKLGQLKVMRSKQREGLRPVVQVSGYATGQRQTIKGGGAPANFIHQHQRMRCRRVQDLRGLGHFKHEGGLRVGHIIGRAYTRMDGVYRPQPATGSRHVRAHAGQQNNDGDLAHVGGFAAHVGACNDLHAALAVHARHAAIVGNECTTAHFSQSRLNHRMAALRNVYAGFFYKHGHRPVQG